MSKRTFIGERTYIGTPPNYTEIITAEQCPSAGGVTWGIDPPVYSSGAYAFLSDEAMESSLVSRATRAVEGLNTQALTETGWAIVSTDTSTCYYVESPEDVYVFTNVELPTLGNGSYKNVARQVKNMYVGVNTLISTRNYDNKYTEGEFYALSKLTQFSEGKANVYRPSYYASGDYYEFYDSSPQTAVDKYTWLQSLATQAPWFVFDDYDSRCYYADVTTGELIIYEFASDGIPDVFPNTITDTVYNTVARKIKKAYIGDSDNKAKIVYQDVVPYLTFESDDTFSLSTTTAGWDGTLEYSYDTETWSTWDGSSISGRAIYMRGTGNTKLGIGTNALWNFEGSNDGFKLKAVGNIETLLDYAKVSKGIHPSMAKNCYGAMFYNCTALVQAPELPAITLSEQCYQLMFYGCTSLAQAPELPAITLNRYCYNAMFYGCTSLTQAPALPATTLADYCYYRMFYDCTSLTQAPELPAITLNRYCYSNMFRGCTALTQVHMLPNGVNELPRSCCEGMYQYCTSIFLSENTTSIYNNSYQICSASTVDVGSDSLTRMFYKTSGPFTDTPSATGIYYLHKNNSIIVC